MTRLTVFFLFILPFLSCNARLQQMTPLPTTESAAKKDTIPLVLIDTSLHRIVHFHLPYQMGSPAESFEMPKKLKEISGLSMSTSDKNIVVAIQDEDGILFHINKNTGEVNKEIPFYKPGDYEGVEVVRDTVYVIKSTGTLYEVSELEKSPPYVMKRKFFLTKSNDVEGLCYDEKENRLLVACKGMPVKGKSEEENKFQKAIYSLDLETDSMDTEPAFIFNLATILDYLKGREAMAQYDKLYSYFNPEVDALIFSPSAIAIHPLTGNIYMTSSPKKILMVFDRAGNILHLEKMDKSIHPQPEGLTFDEDGTLYMVNEGKKGGMGTLLKFAYQPEIAKH